MDLATRNYINLLAERVISAYDIAIPIRDIDAVVRRMGGTIETQSIFDSIYDGTIMKSGNNSFRIVISDAQNAQRRNFTIAHELGHLFLHMGYRTNKELWDKQDNSRFMRFGTSDQEFQANEFAAALLMPKGQYLQKLREYSHEGRIDMNKMSSHFNVSLSAATNRGRFLGVIYG